MASAWKTLVPAHIEGIELKVTEGVCAMRLRKLNQVMGSLSRKPLVSSKWHSFTTDILQRKMILPEKKVITGSWRKD